MNAAYPCLVCGAVLESAFDDVYNQPSEGTEFSTGGHYGSTFFDSFDGEEAIINVCDLCLRLHQDRVGVRKVRRMVVAGHEAGLLVGTVASAVSYRAYGANACDDRLVVTVGQIGAEYSAVFPHRVDWHPAWSDIKESFQEASVNIPVPESTAPAVADDDSSAPVSGSVEVGANYERPGDLFPRCEGCGSFYGCMRETCKTCLTTNLCHGCAGTPSERQ